MQNYPRMPNRNSAPSKLFTLSGYGLALRLVLFARLVSPALQNSLGNPFWFFFSVAVILSTWFGRAGAGWLGVICSTLAVTYYFTPPLRSFAVKASELPLL